MSKTVCHRLKPTGILSAMVILLIFFAEGCGVYSFTGASVPPQAKTVSVAYFPNKAPLVAPLLSPVFTDALRDKFTREANLNMVEKNGDLAIDGEIIDYKTTPVAIQGNQTAALNRLTIVVNVRFVNKYEPDNNFEQKFTEFYDYPSDADLNSISGSLIETITALLVTDIFNKAVVNW